jgi:hypothetical protein
MKYNGIAKGFSLTNYLPIPTDVSQKVKQLKREAHKQETEKLKRKRPQLDDTDFN